MLNIKLGPIVYRALDGVSDYAAIVTKIESDGTVCLTTFPPSTGPTFLTRIKYDKQGTPQSAKPGTCYVW